VVSALSLAKWAGAGMLAGALAIGAEPIAHRLASSEPASGIVEMAPIRSSRTIPAHTSSIARSKAPAAAEVEFGTEANPNRDRAEARDESIDSIAPPNGGGEGLARPSGRELPAMKRAPLPAEPAAPRFLPADEPSLSHSTDTTLTRDSASLHAELALLESARNALGAGDVAVAQASLARYRIEYSAGLLRVEADVLQVQVWLARGNRADATALAERLLIEHPGSPYVDRVRALLSAAQSGTNR
jgi:hypothetical protein